MSPSRSMAKGDGRQMSFVAEKGAGPGRKEGRGAPRPVALLTGSSALRLAQAHSLQARPPLSS